MDATFEKKPDRGRPSLRNWRALLYLPLSFAVLAAILAIHWLEPPFQVALRNLMFDRYQQLRPREYQPMPVRILDIDEESLQRLGQWPWPRDLLAEMVWRLQQIGASAIAFDIVFADPDRTAPARLAQRWSDHPELVRLLETLPDPDHVLAEVIAGGGVITGFAVDSGGHHADALPARPADFILEGEAPLSRLHRIPGVVTSLPALEGSAAGNGAFIFTTLDGVIRHIPLLVRLGEDEPLPTLVTEALRVVQGETSIVVRGANGGGLLAGPSGMAGLKIGGLEIDTDPHGELWLHFSGHREQRYIPAWRLLADEVSPEEVAGSILLLGASAPGLMDLRFNALGQAVPGVEIHAEALEQIMLESYLRRPEWAKAAEAVVMVLLWLVVILTLGRLGALWSAIISAVLIGASILLAWYAFVELRLLLDPLSPAVAGLAVYLTGSLTRHVQAEQDKRWIRDAFSSYVSPNLVDHLLSSREELKLGGESRECAFIFTDLAGFTTLMERFSPEEAVHELNTYLDGMISIAFAHEGTLDRIVGDAVAIVFSAPLTQEDYAERALRCALEMKAFADEFARSRQEAGIPFGITRFGVHCGRVLVGNFGGNAIFDYRALGDPVNTAARLESVNKHLGTRICVSKSIVDRCPEFKGRPVGALVLKGKSQGLEVFEPGELAAEHLRAYEAAFSRLDDDPGAAAEAFAQLVEAHPDDGLARFHLERLRSGERGSLITMASK